MRECVCVCVCVFALLRVYARNSTKYASPHTSYELQHNLTRNVCEYVRRFRRREKEEGIEEEVLFGRNMQFVSTSHVSFYVYALLHPRMCITLKQNLVCARDTNILYAAAGRCSDDEYIAFVHLVRASFIFSHIYCIWGYRVGLAACARVVMR